MPVLSYGGSGNTQASVRLEVCLQDGITVINFNTNLNYVNAMGMLAGYVLWWYRIMTNTSDLPGRTRAS